MKTKSAIRFLTGLLLGIMLAALVAFNTLLVWVATGPRSLANFTPYIERALVGESGVHVTIEQTWLVWDGWEHPIDLHLKNVSVFTPEGAQFSEFPDISLGIDVLALPFGQILPTSLSVTKPVITLRQNADKSLGFTKPAEGAPVEVHSNADALTALIESLINPHSKSSLRKLRTIELLSANFAITNADGENIITAPDTTFVVRKQSRSRIQAVMRGVLNYGDQQSPLNAQFAYNKSVHRFEGVMDAENVHVATLAGLLLDNSDFTALQFPLSGKVAFAFTNNGKLDALEFDINGGRGKIVHPRLDGELPVHSLKLVGKAGDALSSITIDNAAIDFAGSQFTAKGTVTNTDKGMGITGEAAITDVPTEQAHLYWPLGLAPLSREWVTTNIHDGGITKASAKFAIKPGDLALPLLPKEDVDAQIDLKDARIKYLQGHPEVRGVNALIHVDGLSLDANISSASAFADTRLSNGHLSIPDLNPDNPLIELSMHADAAASDAVTLLGLPMLEHAKRLNLDAKRTTGRVAGDAKLGFYFFAKDAEGKDTPLTYNVKARLDKVAAPAFLSRFDIENASGDLTVDEKSINYNGTGIVNGAAMSSGNITYHFLPQNGIDTIIEGAGGINDVSLARFGVRLPIPIKTTRNVRFTGKMSTQKSAVNIPSFTVTGEGINVAGNALLSADGKDLAHLQLDRCNYDKTKLTSLEYTSEAGGYSLTVQGDALDASDRFGGKGGDGFSFEHFPPMQLDIDVGTLYGASQQTLTKVKGELNCMQNRCSSADMRAVAGDKPVSFTITPEGKGRKLAISAGDAGSVLRAIGITDSMTGGTLSANGQWEGDVLTGELRINDYTLKHAPLLAKMLSLASITGFLDTLSGNGIAFKKLIAPFTLSHDVITLKDAKTFGPAMGLNASGTITFPASTLKLDGTIVPSYTLNNVVGKVPLLGNLLTGGEGQGVFAARYSMSGSSDDPNVSVNPLSILTPGFLRNLFDVF